MNQRFYSLDIFRGATVCLMILVNNPGTWSHIYDPLEHAPWHGLTPTDLVFPFFLFAVGNAMAFVMPKLEAAGDAVFWKKILKRTLIIFLIGLFLNWWPFVRWQEGSLAFIHWVNPAKPDSGVRILGVLQRIALCYFFASVLIYYLKPVKAFYAGLVVLLLYWMLCWIGNPQDPYSLTGWFGTGIDKKILHVQHMYKGEGVVFDPEGLVSTLPAIVQVIFGFLVGDYIQKKASLPDNREVIRNENVGQARLPDDREVIRNEKVGQARLPDDREVIRNEKIGQGKNFEMVAGLFVIGSGMLITGFCWDLVFPINKKIWTSSYTVYTSGLATIIIATMIYMIEFKNIKGGLARFFDVFGKNALFVFALSAFLPKGLALLRIPDGLNAKGVMTYVNPWNWLYKKVLVHIPGPPEIGSLLYAVCVILFMWAVCYWMDKKRIYIKV